MVPISAWEKALAIQVAASSEITHYENYSGGTINFIGLI